ncbi:MAG: hypothetical protein sL5_10200 [Candidatus Mesenet longicola]|uniref:Uncharacterized protein n=1 Tax=Candidatus Mesenet longicola TaxID=1892558 RepID=A0A8J3MQX8_9RICK|nr:MAG: hypothetical protein sGL2_10680 [Candidatus Mesenet longicola]GHM60027.1 MAG: hypothetical protein sL5_10200 [Candidatus Mesenet longicola]
MNTVTLVTKNSQPIKIEFYDTSGDSEDCLLNALFGDISEGSAITIKDKERTKKMREEIREFLKSGYGELLKKNKLIKDTIIGQFYESLYYDLDEGEQIVDKVKDGEQLSVNLIPIIMFLGGIEKVTLYISHNRDVLNAVENVSKEEYELPDLVYDQVTQTKQSWGDLNVKEHIIFLYLSHYYRAKAINTPEQVFTDRNSVWFTSDNNQNGENATSGDNAVQVNSGGNINYNQSGEDKKALAGFKLFNNQASQTKPKNNSKFYVGSGIAISLFLGLSIAYLVWVTALISVNTVAVFFAAAIVSVLVGYGIGKLCEKVSEEKDNELVPEYVKGGEAAISQCDKHELIMNII